MFHGKLFYLANVLNSRLGVVHNGDDPDVLMFWDVEISRTRRDCMNIQKADPTQIGGVLGVDLGAN
jgi:hypothetical protein